MIGWWGTTWNFSGTLTVNDTEDGTYSENVSMTIEFPESGGVKISGGGDFSELAGSSKVKIEETRTGVIITISGSSTETDSEGSHTSNWAYTLTLNHTSATQATMDWSGQDVYSGWHYILKEKHSYGGRLTTSGQLTGTRTN